ncbi:MAG: molybdenum cofactor guanylyltransferase [Synechococcales cyanobacterium C42_A2020_086]|nr:molybdenum cofactor guanylyltransferase [Synechococcales cyanobacterium C42_A2020_086]
MSIPVPSPLSLSAIVLAGGLSSRMGQDKALMTVAGTPLLLRICHAAQCCTSEVYVMTPWPERYASLLSAPEKPPIQLITETVSPQSAVPHGPLVGFAQALTRMQSEWVLLLACDLPRLQVEILQSWMQMLPQLPETIIAALPRHPQGWWEPLCGFYRRRSLADLEAFIARGGRSFQQWLQPLSVHELPLADPAMLLNCNTPEELQRLADE